MLLIVAVIITAIFFSFYKKNIPDNKNNFNRIGEENNPVQNPETNTIGSDDGTSSNLISDSSTGGSGGSSGSSETGTGDISEEEDSGITLPSDTDSAECGSYFSEYNICSGTCPSGTCTSEGRSCYCKE